MSFSSSVPVETIFPAVDSCRPQVFLADDKGLDAHDHTRHLFYKVPKHHHQMQVC